MYCIPPLNSVAGIVTPPMPVNATLGSTATFNCAGIGVFVLWRVDDKLIADADIMSRGIDADIPPPDPITGIRTITLRVPATIVNNGTKIWCTASSHTNVTISPTVALLVQGIHK